MSATRWYVRTDYDFPAKQLGSVVAQSIDVGLTLARLRWGHNVCVSNLPPSPRPLVITYHSPSVVQDAVAATPDVDFAALRPPSENNA